MDTEILRHASQVIVQARVVFNQSQNSNSALLPSFEELAAELRKMTRGRRHTPAEDVLREGREER